MIERADAFDVITDNELAARTASLRRNFALMLAARRTRDVWYSYATPQALAEAIRRGEFDPSGAMFEHLLKLSSSIDSKMLEVLRDVGVGAPQFGVAGMAGPAAPPSTHERSSDMPKPARRGLFR